MTNPQIGEQLFMSRSTVKTHLAHIFNKLGVTSRAALASENTRTDQHGGSGVRRRSSSKLRLPKSERTAMFPKTVIVPLIFALFVLGGCNAGTGEPQASPTPDASPTETPTEPGGGDLEDGRHFGFIRSLDVESRSMEFDGAVWLTGDAAQQAASERGEVIGDDVFDFFVVNDSQDVTELQIAEEVTIRVLSGGSAELRDVSLEELGLHLPRPNNGFWVEIEDGAVVSIEEQYVP